MTLSVGEDDVAEETGALVFCERFHDRLAGAGYDFPGSFKIEQQGAEAVAVFAVGAVVDFDPTFGSADGGGTCADAGRCPTADSDVWARQRCWPQWSTSGDSASQM